jgi:hypothetical protein
MKRGDVKLLILQDNTLSRVKPPGCQQHSKKLALILAALKSIVHTQNLEFCSEIILKENPRGHPIWVDRHLEKHYNTTKTH